MAKTYKAKGYNNFWGYIVALVAMIIAFYGVTYTDDWENYEYAYYNGLELRDFAFGWLSEKFYNSGLEYVSIYKFHIVLISCLFVFFIKKIGVKPLLLILIILCTNYVAIGNQIRFYVALPISFLALYYIYCENKIVLYVILSLLSLTFHGSLFVLHGCFWLYALLKKYKLNNNFSVILVVNILIWLALSKGLYVKEQYEAYSEAENISSIVGGIFVLIPCLCSYFLMWRIHKQIISLRNDKHLSKKYNYIYILSICTMFLLITSAEKQVFCSRFMYSMLFIWVAYFEVCKNEIKTKTIIKMSYTSQYIIIAVFLLYRYVLPFVLNIYPEYTIELTLMMNSYKM